MKKLIAALLMLFALQAAVAAVDLNTATAQQLEALNGIGPAKAKAIIEYRTKNGPFRTANDLTKIPGIKQGTLAKIRADLTIGGRPVAVATTPPAKPSVVKTRQ